MNCPICAICYDRLEKQRNKEFHNSIDNHLSGHSVSCASIYQTYAAGLERFAPNEKAGKSALKYWWQDHVAYPQQFSVVGEFCGHAKNSFTWIGFFLSREVATGQIIGAMVKSGPSKSGPSESGPSKSGPSKSGPLIRTVGLNITSSLSQPTHHRNVET